MQQLLARSQETSQTVGRPMVKAEDFLQDLKLKVATMTAEENGLYSQAKEELETLKAAEAAVALRLTFSEAAREDLDTHTAKIAKLQKQLSAKSAELLQRSAKHIEPTDKSSRVKSQIAAGASVLNNLKSVAGNCERLNKRPRVTRQCAGLSTTLHTAAFSALLDEREDYKNCCETLGTESHCIPGLAAEAKK